MSYQGGKQKIGKQIYSVLIDIENLYNTSGKKLDYLEPFVGFCGVIKHFENDSDRNVYACDINQDIIDMWRSIVTETFIPDGICSKEKWKELETLHSTPEKTLYGHVCSFGGLYFNYYLTNRDYAAQGARSVLRIKPKISNVIFLDALSYEQHTPNNMLIYCDPPYINNQLSNKLFQKFDHNIFWNTMRKWSKNNIVIISEKEAPEDFKCIWSLERREYCQSN